MPRQSHGGTGQVNYGGATAGGGPDAAWLQNVSPANAAFNSGADTNPYANVGKFNANVMSPAAFNSSMANNAQNGGLIHGMAAGVFGPGAMLGGVPVLHDVAMGGAGLLDWVGTNIGHVVGGGGDVLGNLGKVKINPFADMGTAAKFEASPETPEKAEIRAMQGGGFWGNAEAQAKYLVDIDRKYYEAHPEDTGPLGLYGILPEASEFGAVNRGDLGQAVGAPLMGITAILRYFSRALSGSQAAGFLRNEWTITDNAIEILSKRPPEELDKVQAEAVAKYKSGEFSNDKAIDFLIRNNAGLNDNPIVNIVMEAALDPTVYGSFGGALLARGGQAAGKIATTLKTIDALEAAGKMTVEEAALSRQVVGMKKSAIEPIIRGIEKEVADGALTEAQGKLRIAAVKKSGLGMMEGYLARTVGPYALPVMMHPTYGPIAAKVHNLLDPTRILFPEKNHASRVLKSRLSMDSTAAVTHGYGLMNTEKVYTQIAKFKPDLAQKVMDDIGGYTAGLTRVWAGDSIAKTILKRAQPTFGDIGQAIDTRLANLPDDFFVQLEYLAVDVMPLSLTPEGVATRMAVAYGDEAADYLPMLKTLNAKGLAYLHAATTQRARGDLLSAIAKQSAAGTWKHPVDLAKLILIAPGELTKQRATELLKQLRGKTLTDAEKADVARAAVQKYDVLRKSHKLLTGAEDVDGVKKIIKHIETLKKEDALAAEMRASDIAKLTGEVFDWTTRYGRTADGEPMYTIGFRPDDNKLWRAILDKDTGATMSVAPWVDYVAEAAANYRPGFGRTLPGMAQRPADWLQIAKDNLFHSVSTQRVAIEAENRFIRIGVQKLGMTENEARLIHTKLDQTAQSGEHAMRGMSATDMWKAAESVLPYRLRGTVGRREIVDAVLAAYKSEFHVVGATQLLTGALKQYLDRIPIMNMGGGNYIGQISEKAWPNLKFKFNPYFQFQETNEGQFFSMLKGVMPFWRGQLDELDERAFRVWGTFDSNLEGVGDQLERSVAVTWGSVGETLSGSTGIKRIKYVNAVRQMRKSLGEQIRQQWSPEFLSEMRAQYHTLDDGEVAIRFLDDMTMENQRVLHDVLELGKDNSYESVIKAAAWSKPVNLGILAPLHMDEVARLMDLKTEGELIRAVRSKKHPLTSSDVVNKLKSQGAVDGYVQRVVNDLKFMGIEKWWERVGKAYDMNPAQVEAFRNWQRGEASAHGMSESEWISQRFSNEVRVFGEVDKLPQTTDIMHNAVRQAQHERNKVVYAHDDPDVLRMTQMTQEQYLQSVPNPRKLAQLQRTHDAVNENPAAYSPGARGAHRHTENGYTHITGEVNFEDFAYQIEQHVGSGYDPVTGQLINPTAITDATRWYRELPGLILSLVDGDVELASKIYLAWTFSQKSDSPINGFIRTLRAADRQQFATEAGLTTFMRDDLGLAREAIAAVLEGRPVTSGLGIKLWDFSGAALGMNKRVVGHHLPSPADRWAFRGAGFMDTQGLGQFMRAYGYATAEEAGYMDPAPYLQPVWTKEVDEYGQRIQALDKDGELKFRGDAKAYDEALAAENLRRSRMRKNPLPPLKRVYTSVGPAQYEYVTKWLNDMTAAANAAEWMGKTDWLPRDLQALDWVRIQKAFGAYPEGGADMVHAVTSKLALSVDPMKRGEWGTHIEDWGQFTGQDRADFTAHMAHFTAAAFSERLGIKVPAIHFGHSGVHLGNTAPWMGLSVAGTNEISERAALSAMAMHQADYAVAIREVPDFKTARVRTKVNGVETELGFRHAIDFEMGYPNAEAINNATSRLSELPSLRGATLVPHVLPDGTRAVRFVWNRISPKTGRVSSTTSTQTNALIDTLAAELDDAGLTAVNMRARSVHVQEYTHDWATDPKAHAISRRLEGLGVAGHETDRHLFGGARHSYQQDQQAYRGATPGEHAGLLGPEATGQFAGTRSPLVGETRAERDRLVSSYLRNPIRGSANADGTYASAGAVNEGVHGYTVAPPHTLTPEELAQVEAIYVTGDYVGAANLRNQLQGYMNEGAGPRILPTPPGVTPLPPGYIRAYHYTGRSEDPAAALESIRSRGLLQGKAEGEKYGEPNQIWFSSEKPAESHHYVEVHLRADQITGSGSGHSWWFETKYGDDDTIVRTVKPEYVDEVNAWADKVTKNRGNFAVARDDIAPSQIVSYNEPWMHEYRSLAEDGPTDPVAFRREFGFGLSERMINSPTGQAISKRLEDLEAMAAQAPPVPKPVYVDPIERMRRRQPGAYLEDTATKEGYVSLVPFDSMMRASGLRPSMFPSDPATLEWAQVSAKQHQLVTRGFDEPIVLEYSIKNDAVRFANMDDGQWVAAADAADVEYIPAMVVMVEDFPPGHPQYGNWQGENVFSPLTEDDDAWHNLQQMLDEGGVLSPEDLGMTVDRGFGEGLESQNWQATHEISQAMTGHAATITQTPGYLTRGGQPAQIFSSGERMVERMLEGIYDSPGGRIQLYSGQRQGLPGHGRYENPEVGDVIAMPLKATSPDPEMAHRFSQGTNWETSPEPGFVYIFPEGTRGIVQDARFEIVVSGKFRVANVIEMDPLDLFAEGPRSAGLSRGYGDISKPVKVVELEPVEIFNPHTSAWEPYHRTQPMEPDTSGMTFMSQNDEVIRGASQVGADGRVTLWASKDSASPMVFAHEMAHAMHVHLDPSMQSKVIKQFNAENKRRLTRWNREVSEWFADSFIRYLREGSVHEDPDMQRAFRYFSKWADRSIKKGLLKGEEKGLAARGALSREEGARLQVPLREGHKAILDEITAGPKAEATHYNHAEEAVWTAATDAVKAAGYDTFRVNFFKRNRSLLERSVNHPIFGLYPASYMWGKVLPEMIRFIAKDPFGLPGGHVAYAMNDVWRGIQQQSVLDPDFAEAMENIGKNGAIRFLALSLPGTPWELSVNSAAWTRRLAQAGLENEALVAAGKKPKDIDYFGIFKDTMQYQFGTIPNTFDAALKGVSGLEDIYAAARGEPTTGKKAPSIGKGLEQVTANINSFGDEIGENLPSVNDVFATDESNISDITEQNDALQAELDDAQLQLQGIFERYPFTQQ